MIKLEREKVCGSINLLEYLTEDEIENASNIVVFDGKLLWFKGKETITPKTVWETINFKISEHPEREVSSKNIYVTDFPEPIWSFNELTSDYHREKGQNYLEVTLEEGSNELDVLGLASGMVHLYGYFFTPHTVSERRGVYHITGRCQNEDDLVPVFKEVESHQKEIQKKKGLFVTYKVRRTEGRQENEMPKIPSEEDWDW